MGEIVHELFSSEQIKERVKQLAGQINEKYRGTNLHLICILRGSVFFFADLARELDMPVTVDFMAVSSYGDQTTTSGSLKIAKDLSDPIEGRQCLIVEDIVDSGTTMALLKEMLIQRNPKSIEICALLDKPSRRTADVTVDYFGFEIPDAFVVGYGLDYAQKYRNLAYIGSLEFTDQP